MFATWFADNIYNGNVFFKLPFFELEVFVNASIVFGYIMFFLFLWASFHLITDLIMAFRAVFGFGYKKRKGGSH